ncbi:MAG TPA: MYXO-CTERM sorting domain-containing protein [Nannocystaceae bacterium]|nr:MYXO-CTERM sorting domain-containing protein [Nannocystaceae bacterium]
MSRSWAPMVLIAWLALPSDARAIDGGRPRTLVLWPDDTPCLVEVDRSIDPVVNLPYAIPFEDPAAGQTITEDEVADGRRHQFFAFAQDIDPRIALPAWISWADIDRAAMLGIVDPMNIEDDWVLDGHPLLGSFFVRIDADDARHPITLEVAALGADWDTSMVSPGTYVVRAYTWDPWPNDWADPRHGALRVYDDVDDPTLVPALAVDIDKPNLFRNEVGTLSGCLAAPAGTTLTAAWADFTDPDGPFTDFADGIVADDGVVAIMFEPPEPLWGGFAVIRVSAIDPTGLRYDAFVPRSITILASDKPADCDEGTGFVGAPGCGSSEGEGEGEGEASSGNAASESEGGSAASEASAGTTGPSGSGSDSGSAPERSGDEPGCGCATPATRGDAMLALLVLALRRRRQR